jgi:hypothetical protein
MAESKKHYPSIDRIRELFTYDENSGLFFWHINKGEMRIGDIAGSDNGRGYIRLTIDGDRRLAHLVVWFLKMGVWPTHKIDHEDGDGFNNRWSNLRRATQAENLANKRISSRNKSGFKGVIFDEDRQLFRAEITKGSYREFLGRFRTAVEAHAAYAAAAHRIHGEFARIQ